MQRKSIKNLFFINAAGRIENIRPAVFLHKMKPYFLLIFIILYIKRKIMNEKSVKKL